MKFGFITQGSNGDTEIIVSLALGLVQNKHEVELFIITLNNRDYSFLNQVPGLIVHQKYVHTEFKEETDDLEFWKDNNQTIFHKLHELIKDELVGYSYKFAKEKDVVLGSHHIFELPCIAEKYHTPYISVNYHLEQMRTNTAPPFQLSSVKGKSIAQLWDGFESVNNVLMKRPINKFRREQGLPPIKNVLRDIFRSKFLNLIPYSSHIYKARPDWNNTYKMTGYWQTGTGYNHWTLPESLANFIEDDEKPVIITVGSMAEHEGNTHEFQQILIDTARQVPRKVIILTHWEQGNHIDGNIYKLKGFVSYPVLFSKCSLVVHHGGIGALHHATGAGCPSVIIKYGHDQPFNAKVLYDAGISSGSIHRKDLNAKDLANLINKALGNKEMKQKAERLAVLVRNENGVENAVKIIEEKVNAEILINS